LCCEQLQALSEFFARARTLEIRDLKSSDRDGGWLTVDRIRIVWRDP
jgi:hypothetical protein